MPIVLGVKFRRTPKTYYFDPNATDPAVGECVIVETAQGQEMAEVVMPVREVDNQHIIQPLKSIVRVATSADIENAAKLQQKAVEARPVAQARIAASGLDMKLVDLEYTFDGNKLVIYFTADGRVDFRELVRDLAGAFRTRIELRQIGGRDECKRLGGIAHCGRVCCCAAHMDGFASTNIRMAKTQSLSLNPTKISGLCGRLMCCLSYENATYAEINKRMPKQNSTVTLTDGRTGTVVGIHSLAETVDLRIVRGDTVEFCVVPLSDIVRPASGKSSPDPTAGDEE